MTKMYGFFYFSQCLQHFLSDQDSKVTFGFYILIIARKRSLIAPIFSKSLKVKNIDMG